MFSIVKEFENTDPAKQYYYHTGGKHARIPNLKVRLATSIRRYMRTSIVVTCIQIGGYILRTLTQYYFDVGSPCATLAQHQNNTDSGLIGVSWVSNLYPTIYTWVCEGSKMRWCQIYYLSFVVLWLKDMYKLHVNKGIGDAVVTYS